MPARKNTAAKTAAKSNAKNNEKPQEEKAKVRIDREEFIRQWEEAESPDAAGKHFGISGAKASQKAASFRSNGIPLKTFSKGRSKGASLESSLALLAKIRGVDVSEVQKESEVLAKRNGRDNSPVKTSDEPVGAKK